MALLNPQNQTIEALQKQFQLTLNRVISVLDFLIELGLVEKTKNKFSVKQAMIHLEKESPLLMQHHLHWRMRAIEAIQLKSIDDLHYSGVISLSLADYDWVKAQLTQLLQEIIDRVKESPDETLATLNFDWFKI